MRYPPRFSHLATRFIVVAKLVPTYAAAHQLEDDEAYARLGRALAGKLHEELLAATWVALTADTARLTDEGLLEKIAGALKKRPDRQGKLVEPTAGWSAFMVLADVHAGTASDAAARLLESEEGAKRATAGLNEVARFLATELLRK